MHLYLRLGYAQIGTMADCNLVGQTEFILRKSWRPRQEANAAASAG